MRVCLCVCACLVICMCERGKRGGKKKSLNTNCAKFSHAIHIAYTYAPIKWTIHSEDTHTHRKVNYLL